MRPLVEIENERAQLQAEDHAADQAKDAAASRQARLAALDAEANEARLAEAERRRDLVLDQQRLESAHRVKLAALIGRFRDLEPDLVELDVLGRAAVDNRRRLAELGVLLPDPVPVPLDLGRTTAADVENLRGLAQVFGRFTGDARRRVWVQAGR